MRRHSCLDADQSRCAVSHHPPISAWYFASPANHIELSGDLRPKSKFLGNSAATIMEGGDRARLLDRPEDGEYIISMPNMYARGILFGKMVLELGDMSGVRNDNQGISCDVEFKTKVRCNACFLRFLS